MTILDELLKTSLVAKYISTPVVTDGSHRHFLSGRFEKKCCAINFFLPDTQKLNAKTHGVRIFQFAEIA